MASLHWNYKDVFRACRLAFSAKKIWMQMIGLAVGGIGYSLLTYLAYATSNVPLAIVWERFSLIPFLDNFVLAPEVRFTDVQWWSWLIWAVGVAWFLLVCLVTGAAVSKVSFEQLRGDDFFETRAAFGHAIKHLGSLVGAPLMPMLFILFLVVCGLVLSLLGAIPVVGEILVGLLALPAFGTSLFIVYLMIISGFALVLVPAVVGTTKNDAFDTLFEVFSCVNEQSWRLVVYTALAAALAICCGAILGWFALQAVKVGGAVLHVFMGSKLPEIMSGAQFYLRISLPTWCPLFPLVAPFGGIVFGGNELTASAAGGNIAAVLIGAGAYVVLLLVLGYAMAVWHTGMTLIFCVLTRKKDDKDLLAEKDTEELLAEEEADIESAGTGCPTPSDRPAAPDDKAAG
jgi:hypothetical protein